MEEDLDYQQTRETLDIIIERTLEIHEKGMEKEVLTVDNHADGPYLWLWTKKNRPELADRVFEMINLNRAKSTGPRKTDQTPSSIGSSPMYSRTRTWLMNTRF